MQRCVPTLLSSGSSSSPITPQGRRASHPSWRWLMAAWRVLPLFAPLEEAVDRHDAAPLGIGITEHRKPCDALSLCVDGPAPTPRVLAPMWAQAPPDKVQR